MEDHRRMTRCVMVLIALGSLAWGGAAQAQGSARERATQKQLNDQATQAASAGEYAKAILFLRSALELGELNVTYLNLGRAYQLNGDCAEARDAYARALDAPPVPNPPPALVRQAIERFQGELLQTCPGTLVIQCTPPELAVRVGEQNATCGAPLQLPPGVYTVEATQGEASAREEVTVVAMEERTVALTVKLPRAAIQPATPPAAEGSSWEDRELYLISGYSLAGLSLAAAVTGGIVRWGYQPAVDELTEIAAAPSGRLARYEQLRGVVETGEQRMVISFGVAGLLGLGAATLLTLGYLEDEAQPPAASATLWWSGEQLGISGSF